MMCVVVLGIVTECIGRVRHDVNKKARRISSTQRQRHRLWYLQTALQGANALMAYVLMLATMTYSLEILICVISGLMIGYFVFGGDLYNHAGSVCCQFLEDNDNDDGERTVVATMTGAILRTLASSNDDGDDNEADNNMDTHRDGGYQSPSSAAFNETGGRESCCNDTGDSGETNLLHTRLLSEAA